ncbi:hypothetical protein LUZ60_004049 [Juncus effusus]|nr:hypothetical protein LUZ60_004049 [Juncus effusus]
MTKVHPNLSPAVRTDGVFDGVKGGEAVVLTVWRKSLLFNGYGFTVFDPKGNLLYRVDNYASESKGEIVLMDALGKPLLTIRRKKLSLSDHWAVYNGECTTGKPVFCAKKQVRPFQAKSLMELRSSGGSTSQLHVEGSYSKRCCSVLDGSRREVASVRCKQLPAGGGAVLGRDVFQLVVEPGFEQVHAMAIVMLLDQMFKW